MAFFPIITFPHKHNKKGVGVVPLIGSKGTGYATEATARAKMAKRVGKDETFVIMEFADSNAACRYAVEVSNLLND